MFTGYVCLMMFCIFGIFSFAESLKVVLFVCKYIKSRHVHFARPFGPGTSIHLDPWVTDAINALLVGHKWWVFLPKDVYEYHKELTCDMECSDIPKLTFGPDKNLGSPQDTDVQNMLW